MMFEKFGFMSNVDELNKAAAGQKEQGDIEALRTLAEENGIDNELVQEYIENERPFLCSEMEMAAGRISLWQEEIRGENSRYRANYRMAISIIEPMMSEPEHRRIILASMKTAKDLVKEMANKGVLCGTDEDLRQLALQFFRNGDISELAEKLSERYMGGMK